MEQFIFNGLCRGAIYAVVALGFGYIYTTTRAFHVAHGFAFSAAAYTLYFSFVRLGIPLPVAVFASLIAAVGVGIIIEALVYRPLHDRRASSGVVMMSSFGAYIVGVNLLAAIFGNEIKVLGNAESTIISIGGAVLTLVQLAQFATGIAVAAVLFLFLKLTLVGKKCRAVADDAVLAEVLGIHVGRTRTIAMIIGSGLAGIGAVLVTLDVGIEPHAGLPLVLMSAVACIAGGLKRFLAPAAGGFMLGVLQSLIVWKASAHWESAITFAFLMLFLLFCPRGLFGIGERFANFQ